MQFNSVFTVEFVVSHQSSYIIYVFNEAEVNYKLLWVWLEMSHNWSVSYLLLHLETEKLCAKNDFILSNRGIQLLVKNVFIKQEVLLNLDERKIFYGAAHQTLTYRTLIWCFFFVIVL